MNPSLLPEHVINGGFPEPLADEPVRVIAARHAACGEATRVRLPSTVPARAVRRLYCSGCAQDYETERVEELGLDEPGPAEPLWLDEPNGNEAQTVDELLAELAGVEAIVRAEEASAVEVVVPEEADEDVEPIVADDVATGGLRPIEPVELYDHEADSDAEAKPKPKTKAVAKPKAKPAARPKAKPVAKPKAKAVAKPRRARKPKLPKLSVPSFSLPRPKLLRREPAKPKAPKPATATAPSKGRKLPKLPQAIKLPKLNPESKTWKTVSLPIAGAAVIAVLLLVQGGGDDPAPATSPKAATAKQKAKRAEKANPPATDPSAGEGAKRTKLVRGSSFSLALPEGWEQIKPPGGATFAAVSDDLGADATLWIEEDPDLDFPTFINQSMTQLEQLAGAARVVERVAAPTPEGTIVRLAADAPPGQPTYEVTLRAAGPYRFYLATSVQPDASREAVEGAELVAGSFTPEGRG